MKIEIAVAFIHVHFVIIFRATKCEITYVNINISI